ncbi:MAG: hypothetical protein ABIZ34_08450, partial [Candidatus Limnocylindrales bacterium]
ILVAADGALVDFTWERPGAVAKRVVNATYYGWHQVRGVRLTSETHLDPASLMRQSPSWGLQIEVPALNIVDAIEATALLDFWAACMEHLGESRT